MMRKILKKKNLLKMNVLKPILDSDDEVPEYDLQDDEEMADANAIVVEKLLTLISLA